VKSRKIQVGLLLTAVAVALLALPALASAAVLQGSVTGKSYPKGTKFKAKSSFITVENTGDGTLECRPESGLSLNTELLENNPNVKLISSGLGESGCASGDYPATGVTNFSLGAMKTGSPGTGTLQASFTLYIGRIPCSYSGEGTFTYKSGTNIIKVTAPLRGPEIACSYGSESPYVPTLKATFELTNNSSPELPAFVG
jgi:hypothetical protein